MDGTIQVILAIAGLPLLPYVALAISAAYLVLAGFLALMENKRKEAFFEPPPGLL